MERQSRSPSGDDAGSPSTQALDRLLEVLITFGVDGVGPLRSAEALAQDYASNSAYPQLDDKIKALIRREATKNFGTGFVTAFGGLAALPLNVSTGLLASWVVQARLSASIASLHGFPTHDDRVHAMILVSLLGNSARDTVGDLGIKLADRSLRRVIEYLGRHGTGQFQRGVLSHLVRKTGARGALGTARAVPIVGGVISGGFDAAGCWAVGRMAHALFSEAAEQRVADASETSPGTQDAATNGQASGSSRPDS